MLICYHCCGAGHGSHLSRSSAFATGVPRVTSLDKVNDGCHWSGSAPDLTKALRMPAEVCGALLHSWQFGDVSLTHTLALTRPVLGVF
jgi:hypothetical protein